MIRPIRLQLSRKKGFDLQAISRAANGLPAVNVARPSKWGNPWRVGMYRDYTAADTVRDFKLWLVRELRIRSAENVFGRPPSTGAIQSALKGKNLACWCPLTLPDGSPCPCHADVLLEVANG